MAAVLLAIRIVPSIGIVLAAAACSMVNPVDHSEVRSSSTGSSDVTYRAVSTASAMYISLQSPSEDNVHEVIKASKGESKTSYVQSYNFPSDSPFVYLSVQVESAVSERVTCGITIDGEEMSSDSTRSDSGGVVYCYGFPPETPSP